MGPRLRGDARRKARSYSSEPPPSPQIPCVRSRMSTAWAKDPGLSGGPGVWVLRSLTTRSRAASSSALLIPVAMINGAPVMICTGLAEYVNTFPNCGDPNNLSQAFALDYD